MLDDPRHDPAPEPWLASIRPAVPRRNLPARRANQPESVSAASPRPSRGVPPFRRLDALGVDDRRRRAGLPASALAQHGGEMVAHALPDARGQEGAELASRP